MLAKLCQEHWSSAKLLTTVYVAFSRRSVPHVTRHRDYLHYCYWCAVMLHWTLVLDSSSWAVTVNSAWTGQLMLSVATNVTRYHKSCHELSTATYLNLEQINEPWFCGKCRTHNSASAISHSYRMILTRSLARLKSQQHTMKVLVRYHHRLGFILPDTAAL